MPSGRLTKLTPAVKEEICKRIAEGESLVSILKSHSKFPDYSNVIRAIQKDEVFRKMYAQAKEDQADYLAEEILEIADDGKNDWMENNDPDNPGYKFNGEHHQRSRLRVDTRKWIASKLKPKKYGERMTHAGDENTPLGVIVYPSKKQPGEA